MDTKVRATSLVRTSESLAGRIALAMSGDQPRLRRRAKRLRLSSPESEAWQKLCAAVEDSVARRARREAHPVRPRYRSELPIYGRLDELREAIRTHQVLIVSGATGSGKTTQLPKICLELGRGTRALIGHTQPRRVAARAVAGRIADELGPDYPGLVGYQVRFNSELSEACRLKVMTDGILLAEVQSERRLQRYDTIIIDEAHERSLNIDFLLGYLKTLCAKRPDLKLIVSSATIDAAAFSSFFDDAPVLEVSGRLFPVEVRYQPPGDEEGLLDQTAQAVSDLAKERAGDILVFLPGERPIRELRGRLRSMLPADIELLPLYARLSFKEQNRVFQPGDQRRRVILATNVAETSLTVPGVRHVVDTGLARISRYSHRSTVQRLPIEPIAKASAEQRKGRAGRLGSGVCIRIYDEADFEARADFSEPEILRANLAAVLLRLLALGWRDVEAFPFLDAPDRRNINDGYRLLRELGALEKAGGLTPTGHRLARLPLDPRVGRMLLEASELGSLREVLIIASGLAIADVRERSGDAQNASDRGHDRFRDSRSDFMVMLRIWRQFQQWSVGGNESRLRSRCRSARLSVVRLREWQEVHDQLSDIAAEVGLQRNKHGAGYARIHRALLAGLLRNVGNRVSEREYAAVRDSTFVISPGSCQQGAAHAWVMAGELVETSRLYAFRVASIRPEWVEAQAGALVRRNHFEAHWDEDRAEAMVYEQSNLYGLVLVARRRVRFAPVSKEDARSIFVRAGLVEQRYRSSARFLSANAALVARLRAFDHKLRRPDVLTNDEKLYQFYDQRLPAEVVDGPGFEAWRRAEERRGSTGLYATEGDLLTDTRFPDLSVDFPDLLRLDGVEMPVTYRFSPQAHDDGVTVRIGLGQVREFDPAPFEWVVPGLLEEKVTNMLKLLPKGVRRGLVPIPECARVFVQSLDGLPTGNLPGGSLRLRLAEFLAAWRGVSVPLEHWRSERLLADLPLRLNTRFEIYDDGGIVVEAGRDLAELQRRLLTSSPPVKRFARLDTFRDWEFGDLPEREEVERDGVPVWGYPALVDRRDSVERMVVETPEAARRLTEQGLRRLFALRSRRRIARALRDCEGFDDARLCYLLVPEHGLLGHWTYKQDLGLVEGPESSALDAEIVDLISARLFMPTEAPLVRSRAAFEARLAGGETRLAGTVSDCAALIRECLLAFKQICALVNGPRFMAPAASRTDIARQLDHLFFRGFVAESSFERLQDYCRYLAALERRIAKLREGGARDEEKLNAFMPYWRRYAARLRDHAKRGRYDTSLRDYRWMLEEYRISLFAQELGTRFAVSPKRLEAAWRLVSA